MPDSKDEIIELTDIIEHGPGVPKPEGEAEGVDLSFERELEDLFAESSPTGSSQAASDSGLPGLDDLHLPEEAAKAEGEHDIDLDGLDAFLAEAEKGPPEEAAAPELPDDFLNEPEPEAPAAPLAAATLSVEETGRTGQLLDGLTSRLDALEDKLSGMGETLRASFQDMLGVALAGLKEEISESLARIPAAQETVDPAPLIEELRQSLEERIDSVAASLPAVPAPIDEEALEARVLSRVEERLEVLQSGLAPEPAPFDEEVLADRVKQEVLAGLPEPAEAPAPADPTPIVEELTMGLRADVEALKGQMAEVDPEVLEARILSRVEERLEVFQAGLAPEPAPFDEEVLADKVRDEVMSGLAGQQAEMVDPVPLLEDLAAKLEIRLSALEAETRPQEPALPEGLVTRDDLDALRREVQDEIRKSVPAAAARIIREEIQALVKELD